VAEQLRVHPDSLRAAGAQLRLDGQALAAALSRLQGALATLGDVCGDDEPGRTFAGGYQPKVAVIERALQNMAAGLAGVDSGLRTMAANYEQAERSTKLVGGRR
jgi:uncharacterized protein YukE